MEKLNERIMNLEIIRFVIVGGINTFNGIILAMFLGKVLQYQLAFTIGYLISMIISFFLNTYFTYRTKPTWRKFITFPISYIPNFIIQYVSVVVFVEFFQLSKNFAYGIAAIISVPVTYLVMRIILKKES